MSTSSATTTGAVRRTPDLLGSFTSRQRADLRRLHLKGLRNTNVSLMLAGGLPVHVVAAWHGHDPARSLSIYWDAQRDDLRAAGATLFG